MFFSDSPSSSPQGPESGDQEQASETFTIKTECHSAALLPPGTVITFPDTNILTFPAGSRITLPDKSAKVLPMSRTTPFGAKTLQTIQGGSDITIPSSRSIQVGPKKRVTFPDGCTLQLPEGCTVKSPVVQRPLTSSSDDTEGCTVKSPVAQRPLTSSSDDTFPASSTDSGDLVSMASVSLGLSESNPTDSSILTSMVQDSAEQDSVSTYWSREMEAELSEDSSASPVIKVSDEDFEDEEEDACEFHADETSHDDKEGDVSLAFPEYVVGAYPEWPINVECGPPGVVTGLPCFIALDMNMKCDKPPELGIMTCKKTLNKYVSTI